jgi:hypothetical protein
LIYDLQATMKKTLHRALAWPILVAALLSGCAGLAPEKRHSPAEIAAYQPENFIAPIASEAGERAEYEAGLAKIQALRNLAPASAEVRAAAPNALWAMGLFNTGHDVGRTIVLEMLAEMERDIASFSTDSQRAVLSAAYTYYASEAAPQLKRLLPQLSTPRQFAIAAYAILKADSAPETRAWLGAMWRWRFPEGANEPRLIALEHALVADRVTELQQRPPLVDLLAAPMRAKLPVVVSFQRRDRQQIGLAMVRDANGKFVRNADGSFFQIPHLAMALTNLPGTITNGNTPQGLFTIVGAGTATNKWIGPTPYLESKVPIEATVAEFAHENGTTAEKIEWTESLYESLLPASWRNYFPFKEAFLAGRAGRDEMLLHGTTVSHDYYRGKSYFPYSPSAGCLVALETWSSVDGRLQKSDQLSLAKAFTRDGTDRGYLIVVELDDRAAPVAFAEIANDVMAAESLANTR